VLVGAILTMVWSAFAVRTAIPEQGAIPIDIFGTALWHAVRPSPPYPLTNLFFPNSLLTRSAASLPVSRDIGSPDGL
jgi:hypothetical protein